MKEIVCTNCKESFSVDDDHFNSKKMVFNCNFCKVEIKRNEESGEWEATESKPVPEKPKEPYKFTTEYEKEEFWRPKTAIELAEEWRGRIISFGWLLSGYNVFILFFAEMVLPITLFAVAINVAKILIITYFVAFLLECLAKHLENQQAMIKLLKKEGRDSPQ